MVSELGARVRVSADTVRYYDRLGLLPVPDRSEAGYRLYGDDAVERLRLIRQAQSLGLRLAQISELIRTLDGGDCPCDETVAAMRSRRQEIEAEIAALDGLRSKLTAAIERADGDEDCEPCEPGSCLPEALRVGGG